MTELYCPLTQKPCMMDTCAWYSKQHGRCGIVAIVESKESEQNEKD